MKKLLVVCVFFFLFVGIAGFLFARWWRLRTSELVLPVRSLEPTSQPATLGSLLTHMRPLAPNEKTVELTPRTTDVSGLIRYTKQGSMISFTVFTIIPPGVVTDIHVWRAKGDKEIDIGALYEGKGGLLLDGDVRPDELPVTVRIAPMSLGKPGRILLEGIIE